MKAKTLIKLIAVAGITLSATNAFPIELNASVDPSLLTEGNSLQFAFRITTCDNQPVCTLKENNNAMAMEVPAAEVPSFLADMKSFLASSGLPAHSTINSNDSFIAVDIIKRGVKLSLPNCTKVINGMSSININVTPNGCNIS